jgi:hypothetical protein
VARKKPLEHACVQGRAPVWSPPGNENLVCFLFVIISRLVEGMAFGKLNLTLAKNASPQTGNHVSICTTCTRESLVFQVGKVNVASGQTRYSRVKKALQIDQPVWPRLPAQQSAAVAAFWSNQNISWPPDSTACGR